MTSKEPAPALAIQDMHFAWPGRAGFSLSVDALIVERGEKLFIQGASGSGKSTLLSVICGIASPQRGQVVLDGHDICTMRPSARDQFRADRVGIIFQMFNLLPFATGLENILLPLSFSKSRAAKLPDKKAEALRLTSALGLSEAQVTQEKAGALSIGQQQRVAAARALIGSPELIVADEPTSALDQDTQGAFVDLLMTQAEAAHATLIMVSHDRRLAERFDRSINFNDIATTREAA